MAETWRSHFSIIVANATGLDPYVVYGWTLAEGGPEGNPLGISPGGKVANYQSYITAATKTIELLRTQRYAGVLRAARTGNAQAQLRAIDASPWNSVNPNYGTLLRGTYERAKREAGFDIGGGPGGLPGVVGDVAGAPGRAVDAAGEALSGVAEFAFDKSALALGYLVLTGAAVALFVMGLNRVSGSSGGPTVQGGARMALAAATRGRGSDIPF